MNILVAATFLHIFHGMILGCHGESFLFSGVNEEQKEDADVDTSVLTPGGDCCNPSCSYGETCFLFAQTSIITECRCLTSFASCFYAESDVRTRSGLKKMKDVKTNEEVLTVSETGHWTYEPVIVDIHREKNLRTVFYRIRTEENEIMVTNKHYLYVGVSIEDSGLVAAEKLVVGDSLLVYNNSALVVDKVVKIDMVSARGISNPIVSSGRIVVNNMLASVYADDIPLNPLHSHSILWAIRILFRFNFGLKFYQGMPWWAHTIIFVTEKFI